MTATALSTRGLARSFGDVRAVDGLDLDVRAGEVYALLGPNGAGKTTTIRMLAGLLRPTQGRIEVLGHEVTPDRPDARRLLGLCPQENVLYPDLTARENLTYLAGLYGVPARERRRRADDLLAKLGLAEKAKARASALSGGMKRRLTVATALIHDPPVVVFDEPEAGLDPQTRVLVREFIRDLKAGKTVVLTSHNMDEVERVADRVAIMDHGRLLALGATHDLKRGLPERLEVHLAQGAADAAGADLRAAGFDARVAGNVVSVAGEGLARRFADVLEVVRKSGGEVADLRYRGATLEDVFIGLTGRGLRE